MGDDMTPRETTRPIEAAISDDVICPQCRGERRIKGHLCSRCNGGAQIRRSSLQPGEQAPFEAALSESRSGAKTMRIAGYKIEITQPGQDKPYLILEARNTRDAYALKVAYEAQGDTAQVVAVLAKVKTPIATETVQMTDAAREIWENADRAEANGET